MTATRQPTHITIYWDSQDPANEGWAYRASDDLGLIASGGINVDSDSIADAIRAACSELDLDLTPEHFGIEPHVDGGYAEWQAP